MLTWNIYHGRSVPPAGRSLLPEFAAALAGWEWDVALLQEVPPWWAEPLAAACGAQARRVLTSRNACLPLRRALAERRPDLLKSNGGGANALLVRGPGIDVHAARRLRVFPERRWAHGVRAGGIWWVNLHASVRARAAADVERARVAALRWAGSAPLVLGGDLNFPPAALPGLARAAQHAIDGIWVRGLAPAGSELPDAGPLSDHRPLLAALSAPGAGRSPGA